MLTRISAPARVVWGMDDTFFSKDSAAYLDRVLPNSPGVRAAPRAKLFFPEETPKLIAEEARQFWVEAAWKRPRWVSAAGVRARIETIFGTWKRCYGLRRMRWRGLTHARRRTAHKSLRRKGQD